MKHLFLKLLFIILLMESCSKYSEGVNFALNESGDNKEQLIKVLDYFSQKEEDSLKLKSAEILISNIPFYSYKIGFKNFEQVFSNLGAYRKELEKDTIVGKNNILTLVRDRFVQNSDSITKYSMKDNPQIIRDIDTINSKFLIDNINLAFEAHNRLPKEYQSNFNDFNSYVLPYRNGSEPLEFNKRSELYKKYAWVYDSIKHQPLEKIVKKIYEDLGFVGAHLQMKDFEGSLSLSQLDQTHFGRCDDMVNYFIGVFRALGFAAGSDYITHWGNFAHSAGHSWFFLKTKNKILPIQVGTKNFSESKSKKIFAVGSMPKIYRKNFIQINYKNLDIIKPVDVTTNYRLTSTVQLQNIFEPDYKKDFKLCVYDNTKDWAIVDSNYVIKNNSVQFKQVARGVLYSICVVDQEEFKLINYPFYLNFSGNPISLDLKGKSTNSTVLRKYPPYFPHMDIGFKRLKSLNYCTIQGSNTLAENSFRDLFKIKNFCSSHKTKFNFNKKENYKYYRLVSEKNQEIDLAEFNLLDKNGNPFDTLQVISHNLGNTGKLEKLIDKKVSTFMTNKELNIIFKSEGQKVSGFEIQARNDDNHINIGEQYELLVFNKGWKTIRKETAKDTVLHYKNLQSNALYVLKNRTKGTEENVFCFDKNGKQFWFGVTDINQILDKFKE